MVSKGSTPQPSPNVRVVGDPKVLADADQLVLEGVVELDYHIQLWGSHEM